jgi:hypothetical protein
MTAKTEEKIVSDFTHLSTLKVRAEQLQEQIQKLHPTSTKELHPFRYALEGLDSVLVQLNGAREKLATNLGRLRLGM